MDSITLFGIYRLVNPMINVNPDSETETTIQMKPIDKVHIDSKTIKKHIETLEFVLSKEINKDLSRDDLINLVKTEIQYINKKMSMSQIFHR